MNDLLRGASFFAIVAAFAALLALVPAAGQDTAGERLYYVQGCYGCHGFDGKSRIHPLSTETSGILADEATFIGFLRMRSELNPILPSGSMPNYPAESLSDDDARAILAHIRAIQSADPEVEDIPLLDAMLQEAAGE